MRRWGWGGAAAGICAWAALAVGCPGGGSPKGAEDPAASQPPAERRAPADPGAPPPRGPATQPNPQAPSDPHPGAHARGELPVLPAEVQAQLDAGLARVRENDLDGALVIFSALAERHPDVFDAYDHRSMIYYNRQEYAKVAEDCTRAIDLARANGTFAITCPDRCLTRRGASYLNLERWDEALTDFKEVLQYRPDDGFTYFEIGRALYGLGRMQEAREHFERALALAPDHRVVAEIAPHYIQKIDHPDAQ